MNDRPARLVLDSSAIAAYVAGSMAVGELLAEIDAEDGTVLIPLPCLIEAAANIAPGGGAWVGILLGHPAAEVVDVDGEQWPMVAGVRSMLGAYEPAAAAWIAVTNGVDVLTRHPKLYQGLGEDITIPIVD